MDIFLDTASVNEIKEILPWGLIRKGCNFRERVKEILSLVNGPLSVELTKTDGTDEEMIREALEYSRWNPKKIAIKVPMFGDGRGLKIISQLHRRRASLAERVDSLAANELYSEESKLARDYILENHDRRKIVERLIGICAEIK